MSLPDLTTNPTGFVLAVADLREQRAKVARDRIFPRTWAEVMGRLAGEVQEPFIRGEYPDHALAEVALWRGIAQRHKEVPPSRTGRPAPCYACLHEWPCDDLLAVVAAAKAYAGCVAVKSIRLAGHRLHYEGRVVAPSGAWLVDGAGHAECECGERSSVLPSTAARRRWHREHKQHVAERQSP